MQFRLSWFGTYLVMSKCSEKFTFINGIYPDPDGGYNKIQRNIIGVIFNINSTIHQTLWLDNFGYMTEDEAIRMVEEYLSEPLTKQYYDALHNLEDDGLSPSFKVMCANYRMRIRGDLLSGFCYLEKIVTLTFGRGGGRMIYLSVSEGMSEINEPP